MPGSLADLEALWSARFLEHASKLASSGRASQYMGLPVDMTQSDCFKQLPNGFDQQGPATEQHA